MINQNSGNFISNSGCMNGGITQQQGAPVTTQPQASANASKTAARFSYDVALSYAGEQEHLVSRVAKILEAERLKVFFAPSCESEFVATDMISRFYRIYRYESFYVAAFVTDDYLRKDITMHEAATAMLRQQDEGRNCLIPIYFGNAVLPQLDPDINYIRADNLREVQLADKIRSIVLSSAR